MQPEVLTPELCEWPGKGVEQPGLTVQEVIWLEKKKWHLKRTKKSSKRANKG